MIYRRYPCVTGSQYTRNYLLSLSQIPAVIWRKVTVLSNSKFTCQYVFLFRLKCYGRVRNKQGHGYNSLRNLKMIPELICDRILQLPNYIIGEISLSSVSDQKLRKEVFRSSLLIFANFLRNIKNTFSTPPPFWLELNFILLEFRSSIPQPSEKKNLPDNYKCWSRWIWSEGNVTAYKTYTTHDMRHIYQHYRTEARTGQEMH